MAAEIRKIAVFIEEIHQEMGQTISPPTRKAAAVAVIANPLAGRFEEGDPLRADARRRGILYEPVRGGTLYEPVRGNGGPLRAGSGTWKRVRNALIL